MVGYFEFKANAPRQKTWRPDENDDKYHQNGSDQAGIDSDQLQTVKRDTDQDRPATDQPKPSQEWTFTAPLNDVKSFIKIINYIYSKFI